MKAIDNCPKCGEKMEKGYFYWGHWNSWSEKDELPLEKLEDGTHAFIFKSRARKQKIRIERNDTGRDVLVEFPDNGPIYGGEREKGTRRSVCGGGAVLVAWMIPDQRPGEWERLKFKLLGGKF